ncbi:sensor histidine kinase [Leucobacter sp. wl10]|uniref:sensor histidine kinase n=1 Tax=Leucobacter sp. wl10 TaxID=2304677 RepID=UPI000E5BD1EF|nr:histidine kinase [Leucobacter sp. wl10]RGE24303.1 sensor histidine kinase [Leucobacter sp. wl10]
MTTDEHDRPRTVLAAAAARPWASALVYLLLAVLFAALGWSGMWSSLSLLSERASAWYALVPAVPACAAVLLKHRAPGLGLAIASALAAADLLTVGGLVPLLVVLELLHARVVAMGAAGRRRARDVVVASVIAVVVAVLAISQDVRVTVMVGLQIGALLGFSYWYANSVAQSRELVRLYRQRAESAERVVELDRAAAVQGERDRMARELHDVVAGHISAVAIRSEAALGASGEDTQERRALRAVRDASLEAHGALRSMIQVLRSGEREFEVPPGRSRVAELVEHANASGVRVRLIDEIAGELPAPVDQAVGRIVQEALANSVRHASGAEVEVRLSGARDEVAVEVLSRGGSALESPSLTGSGMGLELLAERARALGGELSAGPGEAGVWVVRARLPEGGAA